MPGPAASRASLTPSQVVGGVVIVILLLIVLAQCGSGSASDTPSTPTTTSQTPPSTSSATEDPATEPPAVQEPERPAPAPARPYVPAPAPARPYVPAPAPYVPPAPERDDNDSGGVAYYPNCSAARAAGAAPLYRGEPGYASKLDRDNDGVACE